MKRCPFVLVLVLVLAARLAHADDVGNTPDAAEELATGSIARLIERYDDLDVFQFSALPYVTNVVTVSTGTLWDCEMELFAPSGVSVVLSTNTAVGVPTAVQVINTASSQRAYVSVKSLAEFTTGTYSVALTRLFMDSDNDGLPDQWEMAEFGSLTNATAGGDADGDGFSDRDEWLTGTHPGNASSALRIQRLQFATNETLVTWSSLPDGLYRISTAINPLGIWAAVPDATLAESNSTTRSVTGTPTSAVFRVELLY